MFMWHTNKINLLCISYKKEIYENDLEWADWLQKCAILTKISANVIESMWDIDKSEKVTYNLKCNHN